MSPRSPARAAPQIPDASLVGSVPPDFGVADDIARAEIPTVNGTMVTIPKRRGRNTLWNRCLRSDFQPRRWSSIALKKPLMTKNSGIRNPCMAEKTIPKPVSCRQSVTIQNDGKNESDACRTIPSSMAPALRASRSVRRTKAGVSVLISSISSFLLNVESGHPCLTRIARRTPCRPTPRS